MKEKTIYDLPDMVLKAYKKSLLEYIGFLETNHRATRQAHLDEGKTYRSRFVAQESCYLNALRDIKDSIELPQKNAELRATMSKFAERFKV